jgi:hypothetical protein
MTTRARTNFSVRNPTLASNGIVVASSYPVCKDDICAGKMGCDSPQTTERAREARRAHNRSILKGGLESQLRHGLNKRQSKHQDLNLSKTQLS